MIHLKRNDKDNYLHASASTVTFTTLHFQLATVLYNAMPCLSENQLYEVTILIMLFELSMNFVLFTF